MKACGLIVEYNPYHNGHHYHFQQAKAQTNAECVVAVMSGNFLQRGEPAIIDKYARAKIAIEQGVDLVIELPYFYAVQHSELFARGAIRILNSLQVDFVCFGSEHGKISDFTLMYQFIKENKHQYDIKLKNALNEGHAYPKANEIAYTAIGGQDLAIDFTKPNNILGYQYVKNIYDLNSNIVPHTIKRIKNDYHDQDIHDPIASATSIRSNLISASFSENVSTTFPERTATILNQYQENHGSWHYWEKYFPFLKFRVLTMTLEELQAIHGIKEGLENRIKKTAKSAVSFEDWMRLLKTKRYTWTSLQRVFTNILTNVTANEIHFLLNEEDPLGIRLLGMSKNGQRYLHEKKNNMDATLFTSNKSPYPYQVLDERINHAYYSIFSTTSQQQLIKQAYAKPIMQTLS